MKSSQPRDFCFLFATTERCDWFGVRLKADPQQKSIPGPVNRNGIKTMLTAIFQPIYGVSLLKKNLHLKVMKTWLWALPFCVKPSVSLTSGTSWVRLFRLQPDFGIQISQKATKNGFEMHFECDLSPFRIQTLNWSHPWSEPACVVQVSMTSWANFFCLSLVKSKPTWLHPEQLQFEA